MHTFEYKNFFCFQAERPGRENDRSLAAQVGIGGWKVLRRSCNSGASARRISARDACILAGVKMTAGLVSGWRLPAFGQVGGRSIDGGESVVPTALVTMRLR
jgi:hypothetical protein